MWNCWVIHYRYAAVFLLDAFVLLRYIVDVNDVQHTYRKNNLEQNVSTDWSLSCDHVKLLDNTQCFKEMFLRAGSTPV